MYQAMNERVILSRAKDPSERPSQFILMDSSLRSELQKDEFIGSGEKNPLGYTRKRAVAIMSMDPSLLSG